MSDIFQSIEEAVSIGITGHIRPDGDCVGACLGLYNYLQENYNQDFSKNIDLYLEEIPEKFNFLKNSDKIKNECPQDTEYDVFISLDSGSPDRLGKALTCFKKAAVTINIDHHISNTNFAKLNVIIPSASSTCEVLYSIMSHDKIKIECAEALYLGIVHDTGAFRHSNTSSETMAMAGCLVAKGVIPSRIIDETFYQKTYIQNQILGRCLMESMLLLDGKIIVSSISKRIQDFYGIRPADLDGVIDQLRLTKGVEVAIFIREEGQQEYKVSLRSNEIVDVSKIAIYFGGGGHVRAAGCTMHGSLHDVINNITPGIEHQILAEQNSENT